MIPISQFICRSLRVWAGSGDISYRLVICKILAHLHFIASLLSPCIWGYPVTFSPPIHNLVSFIFLHPDPLCKSLTAQGWSVLLHTTFPQCLLQWFIFHLILLWYFEQHFFFFLPNLALHSGDSKIVKIWLYPWAKKLFLLICWWEEFE